MAWHSSATPLNTLTKKWPKYKNLTRRKHNPVDQDSDASIPSTVSIPETPTTPTPQYWQCNGTTTDIFSLPVELLTEIFLYTPESWQCRSPNHYSPVSLTQTCRLWRDVAIHTPLLWNVMYPHHDCSPKLARLWVERASGLFLNLSSYSPSDSETQDSLKNDSEVLSVLLSKAHLWREVCFPDILPFQIVSMDSSMFSGLRHVKWTTGPHGRVTGHARYTRTLGIFEEFWRVACSIPTLQSATLCRIPHAGPWSQFTNLHLIDSSLDAAFRALRQCSHLTSLRWTNERVHRRPRLIQPILIPNLSSFRLSMSTDDREDPSSIFDRMILPRVSQITIGFWSTHPLLLSSLRSMLVRSNAKLEVLTVTSRIEEDNPGDLLHLFQTPNLDGLRTLRIRSISHETAFWDALSQPTFLPGLEELELAVLKVPSSTIETSLKSRHSQGTKLRNAMLFLFCNCGIDEMERPDLGCTKMHSPWDTLPTRLSNLLSVQVLSWGDARTYSWRYHDHSYHT